MKRLLAILVAAALCVPAGASAWWQSIQQVGVSAGGAPTTTLDPAKTGSAQILSNGNLTVSYTSGGDGSSLSIASHVSGKYYAEFTVGSAQTNTGFGFANSSLLFASGSGDFIGNTGGSLGMGYGSNTSWFGGGSGGTMTAPAIVATHTYGLALDMDNHAAWVKDLTAGGNWNANGTANPATNTNGVTFTISGAVFTGSTLGGSGDSVTFNFGATAYTGTLPSGFGNW